MADTTARINWFPAGMRQGAADHALDIPGMPPGFGQPIIPHHLTTAARYQAGYQTYYSGDEAIRDSRQNAIYMRQHTGIRECLLRRQEATALLNWHLQPEDEDDPRQKELCVRLTQILERTKRFTEMRRGLGEAIWYGRAGVQMVYKRVKVRGEYASVIRDWYPVNGDKLAFRFDDGRMDAIQGDVGIRVSSSMNAELKKRLEADYGEGKIHPTERGWAYFMDSSERKRFLLHKYLIEDGPYDDGRQADKVNGVGVRDMVYWTWLQMLDVQSWMMDFLQRSGMGIEVWKYPANNAEAKAACEAAARNRTDVSILTVPVWPGDEVGAYDVEFKEPGFAGVEAVKDLLQSYYLSQIKRLILGQNLTTESDATGLGSGVSDAHMATWSDIIRCDARGLEEDITDELIEPLKLFNFPWARDIYVRFVIDTEGDDAQSKMDAWRQAYDMGLSIKADDVRDLIGASKPDPEDEVLKSPISEDPSTSFFGGFGGGPSGGQEPEGGPEDNGPEDGGGDEPGGPISGMGPKADQLMAKLRGKYGTGGEPSGPEKYARDYSSTQVNLEGDAALSVSQLANQVADLAESMGVLLEREDEPHITVKYGLHTNDPAKVRKAIAECCDWTISAAVGEVSIFKNDDFDVIKLDIESDDLHRLNAALRDSLENTETYPEYKPHVTLAYVKPGEGEGIAESVWNTAAGLELVFDSVTFSDKRREQTKIPLGETCPKCGGKMVSRERRKNGNDTCENGHVYPSADAVKPEKYAKFREEDHNRDEKGRFAMTMRPVFRPIGWSLYTDSHDVIHIPEGELDFEGDPWDEETEELKPEFLDAIKPWTKGKKATVEHAERDEEGGWVYGIEWHGKEPEKWTGANSLGEAIYDLVGQNYGDLDAAALKEVAKLLPGFDHKISDPDDEEAVEDFAKALYRHVRKGEGRKVQTAEPEKYAKKFDESKHPRAGKGEGGGQFVPLAGQKDFFGGQVSEEEAEEKQAKVDSDKKAEKAKASKEQRDAAKAEKANQRTAFDQGKLFQSDEQGGLFDKVYQPKKEEPKPEPDHWFKRSGQQFENLQRAMGINRPVMGTDGKILVWNFLAKHPGGRVLHDLLSTDPGPQGYDQNGFPDVGNDHFRRILESGDYTAGELNAAADFLGGEHYRIGDLAHGNQSRFIRGEVQAAAAAKAKLEKPAHQPKQDILRRATGNTQKRLFSRRGSYDVHADGDMVLIQYARKPGQGQKSLFGDTKAGGGQKSLFDDRKPKQAPKNPEFEKDHPRDDDGTFVEKEDGAGGGRVTYDQAREQYTNELWDTINQRWDDGEMVGVTTRTRYTPLEARHRDRVRLHNGEIQVQVGKAGWSTVTGESLDSLAHSAGMQTQWDYLKELDIEGTSQDEIDEENTQEKTEEDAADRELQDLADKHFGGDLDAFTNAEGDYIEKARQDANDDGVDWPETEELEKSFREGLEKSKDQPKESETQQEEDPEEPEEATVDEEGDEEPIATGHGASLSDIPSEMAMRAHSGTSWVPDRRGAAEQQNYVDHMANVYNSMLAKAKTDEAKKLLQSEFARYRRGYAEKLKDYLGSKSRIVSSMIAGPSNFPVRQMEKRSDAAHKKLQALLEYDKKAQRAIEKKLQPEKQPIRIGDSDAMQRLQTKLSNLERLQDAMKSANKIIRKAKGKDVTAELMELGLSERSAKAAQEEDYMGRIGFPDYALKNNNASIRRVRGQVEDQKRREQVQAESESGDRPSEFEFSGGSVHLDYDDNRLRIEFDQKPDRETISKLKSNGFKWSRANSAWQRQLTENAKRAASTVTGAEVK